MSILPASPTQLKNARAILRGDWDEGGTVSVYLPREQAFTLIRRLGWKVAGRWNGKSQYYNVFRSPDGVDYYDIEEALRVALLAEAM